MEDNSESKFSELKVGNSKQLRTNYVDVMPSNYFNSFSEAHLNNNEFNTSIISIDNIGGGLKDIIIHGTPTAVPSETYLKYNKNN